jgi:hypothetical protein
MYVHTVSHTYKTSWLAVLLRIPEAPCSSLDPETDNPDQVFSWLDVICLSILLNIIHVNKYFK